MKPIALIVEDDSEIREAIADRLESLGHDYHPASSQMEARERLSRCTYDYILLDLELPTRIGRPPSINVGKNILREIRETEKHLGVPVLVVTAHGHDKPDLAVELMKAGASDFVKKPFADLDERIREALGRKSTPSPVKAGSDESAESRGSLEGAELAFHEDRIELAGTEICVQDNGVIWRIMGVLSATRPNGGRRGFPGKALADELGIIRGQNAVVDAISHFRRKIIDVMSEAGFEVTSDSVIQSGKAGYQLSPGLRVRTALPARKPSKQDQESLRGEERQTWILQELAAGRKLRRVDIERHFKKSPATVKRDLTTLADQIDFVGSGPAGHYVVRKVATDSSGKSIVNLPR